MRLSDCDLPALEVLRRRAAPAVLRFLERLSPPEAPEATGYFHHARPDVQALVPSDARDILDVGCAAGVLGAALKAARNCRVVGIERQPDAAAEAARVLDEVHVGDATSLLGELPEASFDAVIAADVLEHLEEPGVALRRIRRVLRKAGVLTASIPNVRHHSVLRQLLEGRFEYTDAGILDRTHLRFFTRQSFFDLLRQTGFTAARVTAIRNPIPDDVRAALSRLTDTGLRTDTLLAEAEVYQYLVAAVRTGDLLREREGRWRGLVSVIIPTWDGLEETKRCVESLYAHAGVPFEIIAVDNGSTDGTLSFWRALARERDNVRLVVNPTNLGYPVACNQGLLQARGEAILLLNNDAVVHPGALARLCAWLDLLPDVGLIGPRSNCVDGPQHVAAAPLEAGPEADRFAASWAQEHDGEGVSASRLVGFCLLGRRDLFEQIGGFDPQFTPGTFEDDDLCVRAQRAGYGLWRADDVFVYHQGNRTLRRVTFDRQVLAARNLELLRSKWGAAARSGRAGVLAAAARAPWEPALDRVELGSVVPLPLASDRPLRVLAAPRDGECAVAIVRDLAPILGPEPESALCLYSRQPAAVIEALTSADQIPEAGDLQILLVDNALAPGDLSRLSAAVAAVYLPPRETDPDVGAELAATGPRVLLDLGAVRDLLQARGTRSRLPHPGEPLSSMTPPASVSDGRRPSTPGS